MYISNLMQDQTLFFPSAKASLFHYVAQPSTWLLMPEFKELLGLIL
jgi:hypothetical protein